MKVTADTITNIAGGSSRSYSSNVKSIIIGLGLYGRSYGLDKPHRFAHFIAQLAHESGRFHYDRELWGPTAAQRRYDTRTDLGNTPQVDGDGYKYRGRGPIQLTGKYNISQFYWWCVSSFGEKNVPNFIKNPDLINTDPWEFLSAMWYWERGNPTCKSLNAYADKNNIELITRRINGGLNGYSDRLTLYSRAALVLLGYALESGAIRKFQERAKAKGVYNGEVDDIDGPKTRHAMHVFLVDEEPIIFINEAGRHFELPPIAEATEKPVDGDSPSGSVVTPPKPETPPEDASVPTGAVTTGAVTGVSVGAVSTALGAPVVTAVIIGVVVMAVVIFITHQMKKRGRKKK